MDGFKMNYRACISHRILLDQDLSANELRLYGIIETMEANTGLVFYSNRALSEILNVSIRAIQQMKAKLKNKGYLSHSWNESAERYCWNTVRSQIVLKDEKNKDSEAELHGGGEAGFHGGGEVPLHGGGEAELHTNTYSIKTSSLKLINENNISESDDSCSSNEKIAKRKISIAPEVLIDVYHQTLPDSPRIKVIDAELQRILKKMQVEWPKLSDDKIPFTIEAFHQYLLVLKNHHPGFLQKYKTKEGNVRTNNLRTIAKFINIAKFFNTEFDFRKVSQ